MLSELKIENIAIIEDATIEPGAGFNVLSGETGAGKSIIIDSISAVLGERTSKELIRTGAQQASVTALFTGTGDGTAKRLADLGVEPESDGSVLISRILRTDGKNICRINGTPVTAGILKQIAPLLVAVHGQHDSQALLDPAQHMSFIDGYAHDEQYINEYRQAFSDAENARTELNDLKKAIADADERTDFLKFQIDELEKAEIVPGEKDELTARRDVIRNSEKIGQALSSAFDALSGDDDMPGASDMARDSAEFLGTAVEYMPELASIKEKLNDAMFALEDCRELIRSSIDSIEYDPSELEDIEDRLDMFYKFSKKYGNTEQDMLDYLRDAKRELEKLSNAEIETAKAENKLKAAQSKLSDAAEKLSDIRREASSEFSSAVCSELSFLDMPGVRFIAEIRPCAVNINGAETLEFLISANAGEAPRPLARIASGGELSRVMLAIKNVLAGTYDVGTLIFDEIDTGVSGSAAQKIAFKLASLAKNCQVICVTHSAALASYADCHLLIEKEVRDGRTYTSVRQLDADQRKYEIARIISGTDINELRLDNAASMIDNAEKEKAKIK